MIKYLGILLVLIGCSKPVKFVESDFIIYIDINDEGLPATFLSFSNSGNIKLNELNILLKIKLLKIFDTSIDCIPNKVDVVKTCAETLNRFF